MPKRQQGFVALLRGINVGGKNRLPMAQLRAICTEAGCNGVRTHIQSGNIVLASSAAATALEKRLEQAIAQEFHFRIPVLVRSASGWRRYVKNNPFPREAATQGNHVLLCVSKLPPKKTAVAELQQRATQGERVVRKGDALWIHYANGIGRSKLTPALLDRHVGSSVTARNWRTVLKLEEMVRATATE
jgi:uncharacterized protein (DUF1697 family)